MAEARRNTFKSPKPEASRLLAFDLLTEVNRNEGYSNLLLPQALNASKLDDRDRSLVTELLYGTIRMQGKHDWVLAQISDRSWTEVDPGIVDVCRLGVHQLHEMRVPDQCRIHLLWHGSRRCFCAAQAECRQKTTLFGARIPGIARPFRAFFPGLGGGVGLEQPNGLGRWIGINGLGIPALPDLEKAISPI